jgi:L-lactate dehydrogenase
VEAYVIGEHGTSQVYLWSTARIGGSEIDPDEPLRRQIEEEVRFANIDIIEGTGASRLGIGVVAARIAEMSAVMRAPWCQSARFRSATV